MPETSNPTFRELGATGLKQNRGTIVEEYLPQLQGERAVKVYREMRDTDPIIGAALFAIEMLIRALPWDVQPFDQTPADTDNAEFVESCMHDMSQTWEAHVVDALSFVQYGWSFFEIVYKRRAGFVADSGASSGSDDGRIGWRKFAVRGQDTLDRWEPGPDDDGIVGLWQRTASGTPALIPMQKAVLYRASHWKNNPEGRSALRTAYRANHYKRRIEEAEAIGIERDLNGIPLIGVPPEVLDTSNAATAAARAEWKEIGRNLRADEQAYVLKPNVYDEDTHMPLYTVELLGTTGRRLIPTGPTIERWARYEAMGVLADVILLGHESVGSFGLAKSKDAMFASALQGFVDEIATVVRAHAVTRLFALNGLPTDRIPMLVPQKIRSVDLEALASFVDKIAGVGLLEPDLDTENELRSLAGLPQRAEDDDADVATTTDRLTEDEAEDLTA